ncbi:ATP-binding protein [Reichenbachiella ulvae]|uniref:histidine kinase n=1 Tax=Reichenbachiella ulvae TaxID=2980104 RepID=A0ABT3CWB0_9BACT|nr:ATP-binding protein [Reichenbachiella ulvae]MCV9387995.1 ATP-binding protein [Reichenbachiella ulvae]
MKKSYYPYFLSASLLLVIVGASVIGYFAYRNLNHIVSTLEEEVKPNMDLILLGELSISLEEMENAIEGFVFDHDSTYMDVFGQSMRQSIKGVDQLKKRSSDPHLLNQLDELQNLILDKATLLKQASELNPISMSEAMEGIKKISKEQKPKSTAEKANIKPSISQDTSNEKADENEKKESFWSRLLGKKKEEENEEITEATTTNTTEEANSDEDARFWEDINNQLDSIARNAEKEAYNQKMKEYTLYQDHLEVDKQITAAINEIENYQVDRIKQMAKYAEDRARFTNRYISIFSVMASIILLMSLVVLFIYMVRSRKYQEVLSQARQSALNTAKEKEQFLANMSHEIRTPMNAIAGFSQVLLQGQLTDQQQNQVGIIKKSSDHLLYILNDILDFTKIQSGNFKLETEAFVPETVIQETLDLLLPKAHEKGLYLKANNTDTSSPVSGDPYRLKQILLNLVFNAIKFTEKGGITIDAKWIQENKVLQFSVTDTGIGIPKEKQASIFSEFEQVSASDRMTGTGLGLAISKKLIDLQKGQISLTSRPGHGTSFSIAIPYQEAETEGLQKKNDTRQQFNLAGLHILIADDELFNRKLLQTILDGQNITFEETVDGQTTYDLLNQKPFDLILLDFRMPKLSGPQISKKIKSEEGLNQSTPIIGLTATVSDEDILEAKNSGIDHILRKPFDTQDLIQLIAKCTNRKVNTDKSPADSIQDFSLENLKKMGDDDFVFDMVETFVDSSRDNLAAWKIAVEEENWEKAADILHKIIAPARHFGVPELVKKLKNSEIAARKGEAIPIMLQEDIENQIRSLIDSLQLYLRDCKTI